jgi:hypothetical protein
MMVPKNHALYELVLQRRIFGPTIWFQTNSKETKHHILRQFNELGNKKDLTFDFLAHETIRQYLRHIYEGGELSDGPGLNKKIFFNLTFII